MSDDDTMKFEFNFKSEAEAHAFQKGIEFVNNSAIDVTAIGCTDNGWTVFVQDTDADGDGV